jgi:hypothetical protein
MAGPDCPEVYFLTGQFSPSGTLFDFFESDVAHDEGSGGFSELTGATVVVLNHRPKFSRDLPPDLVTRIRADFPGVTGAGPFEVRWRR